MFQLPTCSVVGGRRWPTASFLQNVLGCWGRVSASIPKPIALETLLLLQRHSRGEVGFALNERISRRHFGQLLSAIAKIGLQPMWMPLIVKGADSARTNFSATADDETTVTALFECDESNTRRAGEWGEPHVAHRPSLETCRGR